MSKTITIPSSSIADRQDDEIGYDCEIFLEFKHDGTFTPDSNGKAFSPHIPSGPVSKKQPYGPYSSPKTDLDVMWTYTSPQIPKQLDGDIKVRKDGGCSNTQAHY